MKTAILLAILFSCGCHANGCGENYHVSSRPRWSIPESDRPLGGVLWIVTQNPGKHCFKRLETDAEFRKRLREEHGIDVQFNRTSADLDDVAWDKAKVQRRIVEDVA